jgi:hypothetical protein
MNKYLLTILLFVMPLIGMEKEITPWTGDQIKTVLTNIAAWTAKHNISYELCYRWFTRYKDETPSEIKSAALLQAIKVDPSFERAIIKILEEKLPKESVPVVATPVSNFNKLKLVLLAAGVAICSYGVWRLYKAYQQPTPEKRKKIKNCWDPRTWQE